MPKEDNIFTFDIKPFIQGLKKIGQGISGFQKSAFNMAKNVSKGVANAIVKIGLLGLAFKGLQSAISKMPEIGKTFKIAKDIIMKNLLFPLRKAIFPLLQKFLNWVRDNRAMFVKWGQTLVGIFQSVKNAVIKIIDVGKRLAGVFSGFIERIFGLQIRTFQDLINILSFKIAVVIEFLKALLGPVLNILVKVGNIIGVTISGAFETLGGFIDGFINGIGNVGTTFDSILESINEIVTSLFTVNKEGNNLESIFTTIGEIVGGIVKFIGEVSDSFLEGIAPTIEGMLTPLQQIFDEFQNIVNMLFSGDEAINSWKDAFKIIGEIVGGTITLALEAIGGALGFLGDLIEEISTGVPFQIRQRVEKRIEEVGEKQTSKEFRNQLPEDIFKTLFPTSISVDDAIIKPDGTVIRTNPNDTLIATQGGLPGNTTITVDFSGMQIVLQTGTQDEAQRFGENIVDIIRNQLNTELERGGVQ